MNIKHNNLLHYVLIILLMFAPVRSVMAEQSAPCDMDNMSAMEVMVQDQIAQLADPQTESHVGHEQVNYEQPAMDHQCCCCDDGCVANCDMGMTVSLLLQPSPYAPVVKNVADSVAVSTDILFRESTPPSRPPASLYN